MNFSATVQGIRQKLKGSPLRPTELRDLLDQLQEVEATLPPEPTKPEYSEPASPDLPATATRRQRMALKYELRKRAQEHFWLDQEWQRLNKGWQSKYATRMRIIANLRSDICSTLEGRRSGTQPERLPWALLPHAELSEARVISELRAYRARHPELRIDESRLREAYRLGPQRVFVGREGFDGYFAFVFDAGGSVLLDHPIIGNAAFLFGEDWRILSRLSKRELSECQTGRFSRIIHNQGWQSRLRRVLSKRRTQPALVAKVNAV